MTEEDLPAGILRRMAELRACGNVESLTVVEVIFGVGVRCILVPGAPTQGPHDGWAQPTEPHLLVIPFDAPTEH